MTYVPDYGRPTRTDEPWRFRKHILFCALFPLCVGFSILFAWGMTGWSIFPVLGLAWLGFGSIIVFVGAIFVLAQFLDDLSDRKPLLQTLGKAVLLGIPLLSNFPAAWLCIQLADRFHPM
jgi:hypothetical protein